MRDPVETLQEQTERIVGERQVLPHSTYRLQFRAAFPFRDAERIVPYLADLGISHCYASPYLKARPGSGHGYDIVDHSRLNPEVGTEEDYAAWVDALTRHGMGHILDVVPNHMGVVGNENEWWNDVLENGPSSPAAGYFDIDWNSPSRSELRGRVLLPVLGAPYGEVLESQQLQVELTGGAFFLVYFDHRFPLAPRTYGMLLGHRLEELEKRVGADHAGLIELQSIITATRNLPDRHETDPVRLAERAREKEVIKRRLAALIEGTAEIREHLAAVLVEFNGQTGDPRSFDRLDELADAQAYRLSYWRVASDEINYRRFFDINELAALSAEREDVFHATHGLILKLLAAGMITGVRIDHVDGLYDPRAYLERLQLGYLMAVARRLFDTEPMYQSLDWAAVEEPLRDRLSDLVRSRVGGPPLYVVVEKILGVDEQLPAEWACHGTSGYEFLNLLNGLFVEPGTSEDFRRLYDDWLGDDPSFEELAYRCKRLVLVSAMSSELQMLAHQLDQLAQKNRWSRDFTRNSLRLALREAIACFPVYRSYITDDGLQENDRKYILKAIRAARNRNPAISSALFHFVRDTLLLKPLHAAAADPAYRMDQRRFAGKFQQITSPVIAKGIEDTAFYQFNRLLSLNEVGGEPERFGVTPSGLHKFLTERQARSPRALSTTATHDTKRGEDVRARLNVLSELPVEWRDSLRRWNTMNQPHRVTVEELEVPDRNEEYFLYQTLIGTLPISDAGDFGVTGEYVERIQQYMNKALHEAKVHSSWINPDVAYDEAMKQFIHAILDPATNGEFLADLQAVTRRVAHFGFLNSLAQTLLKLAAPGVPDTYQGTELWDFSLVDPDNRRPVDYEHRRRLLDELKDRTRDDQAALVRDLVASLPDERIKLYLTWRTLDARRTHPGLFTEGEYVPLEAFGARAGHVFGFARRQGDRVAVVAAPRLLTRLISEGALPLGAATWADTHIPLPEEWRSRTWRDVLTGAEQSGESLIAGEMFSQFPVALLLS